MTGLAGEIACLFAAPGRPGRTAVSILRDAAAAHLDLLRAAQCSVAPRRCPALPLIASLLPQGAMAQRRFLCDPVLIEGLHELAADSAAIQAWHTCTADSGSAGGYAPQSEQADHPDCCRLGNAALPAVLRRAPDWCGTLCMKTDRFGLLRFAMSDWRLSLTSSEAPRCIAVDEPLCLQLGNRDATWCLGTHRPRPFLRMPRRTLTRMIAYNDISPDDARLQSLDAGLRWQWSHAAGICSLGVRFAPVHCRTGNRAAVCGTIVQSLHDALVSASPGIHAEFCSYVSSILGFDQQSTESGTVQSLSDPLQPRLMGLNVPFTDRNEPRLCPYCLTCLGHEMAHTKMYLLASIGWRRGWRFLRNAGEDTGILPRYGRPLKVRTLFQVPLTHLYEWTILMDACESGIAGFDTTRGEFLEFGDELRDEITDAFSIIDVLGKPTPYGRAALERCRRLFDDADDRWRQLRRGVRIDQQAPALKL